MAEDSQEVSRSIADEIGEAAFQEMETPTQVFFLALFVFGVLTLAATTLVGSCGAIDDTRLLQETRTLEPLPGAIVALTTSVTLGDTIINPGACAIVERVDEDRGVATVHVLAKAQPFFTGSPEEYRPPLVLSGFLEAPFSTLFFLHSGTPEGEVPLFQLSAVPTQPYTNFFRNFYLNYFYIIIVALAGLLFFFTYVGFRYERKRTVWYQRHTLRALYISRLMQDREKTRQLQEQWQHISELVAGDTPGQWKESLERMQETLEGTLVLLRFTGENLTEKLQGMTTDDLWNVERLWQAHSLILHMQGEVPEGEEALPISEGTVRKVANIYLESLIWLGLLPHHLADDD